MAHAATNLLTPSAQVIPCAATVHAFLFEMPRQPYSVMRPLDREGGFDMKEYSTYAYGPNSYQQCRMSDIRYTRITEPFDAWNFDLTGQNHAGDEAKSLRVQARESGRVDGVCFYFTLNLDEDISISTAPEVENCWNQAVTFFEKPVEVQCGQTVKLKTYHKVKLIYWQQPEVIAPEDLRMSMTK